MAYHITLTAEDINAIGFIGDRYCWSTWACRLHEGENTLAEHEAWEFAEAIEADTEGGHNPYPMLNESSQLYAKLVEFKMSIV